PAEPELEFNPPLAESGPDPADLDWWAQNAPGRDDAEDALSLASDAKGLPGPDCEPWRPVPEDIAAYEQDQRDFAAAEPAGRDALSRGVARLGIFDDATFAALYPGQSRHVN